MFKGVEASSPTPLSLGYLKIRLQGLALATSTKRVHTGKVDL